MATKSLFGGVRTTVVGSVLAAAGGLAGCSSSCDPCNQPNPCQPCVAAPVYRSPCCPPGVYGGGGGGVYGGGGMMPAPQPMMPAPAGPTTPQASGYAGPGSQMSCGAGKCG
jgi:hypothetical protein